MLEQVCICLDIEKWEKTDMNKKRLLSFLLIALSLIAFASPLAVNVAFASTEDISTTVMDWMPLIIQFAMLGMILGLLKKFGKI